MGVNIALLDATAEASLAVAAARPAVTGSTTEFEEDRHV